MMTIILDNGHGCNTLGKRSPVWSDGRQLFEWEFNRAIVKRIAATLERERIRYHILVPEKSDISLKERVRRVNTYYRTHNQDAFLLSIHANAGGGTGWEAWTSRGTTKSDRIASIFYMEAHKSFGDEWKIRTDWTDNDEDKEADFYILKNTLCPAVLTENFFMDTERDCRYIMSERGRQVIADMHVHAIHRIIKMYNEKGII